MKAEKEIMEKSETVAVTEAVVVWPEPQTALGATLIALAKELDASEMPKLSIEEIEEYLGRKLGGIAEAYPNGIITHKPTA